MSKEEVNGPLAATDIVSGKTAVVVDNARRRFHSDARVRPGSLDLKPRTEFETRLQPDEGEKRNTETQPDLTAKMDGTLEPSIDSSK